MRIEITAGRGAPPSGDVVVNGGAAYHFDGWLVLLGVLADALDPRSPLGAAGGLGGELTANREIELDEGV